ncbi:nudC domain-containing protein 1 [Anopheles aquasalis]|uniref:nudC domain-containing protein 1 n=1 Tax=Anopheles aquasalis TaxID=42839 RepID=UPI00215A4815|nr:nudC domain-containing protein 1 [Anopheles aquasalis]
MRYTELRPDPQLLKPNYGGFKLSLDTIPVLRSELPATQRAHRVRPNPQRQYSYLHARLFGLQNHLVADPWTPGCLYYIDVSGTVQRVQYQPSIGRLSACCPVYRMVLPPQSTTTDSDPYNCSLVFASDRLCLLADGHGKVSVLQTGNRGAATTTWETECVLPRADDEGSRLLPTAGSVLLDARLVQPDVGSSSQQLHCIALQVEHFPSKPSETVLHWFVLEQQQQQRQPEAVMLDGWTVRSSCQLRSGGFPRYCSLDHDCTGLLLASNKPFTFTEDTEYPIKPEPSETEAKGMATQGAATDADPSVAGISLSWIQTMADIKICCSKGGGINWQFESETGPEGPTFQLTANGEPVLAGSQLFAAITGTPSTSETDTVLELVLEKAAKECVWPHLYEDGPEEMTVGTVAANELLPAPDLDAMLEECDFGDAEGEEQYFTLERLDRQTHRVTDRASLGSQPPLFAMRLQPDAPTAIVVRHHVDACVWQPIRPVATSTATGPASSWNLRHEGTLHTFGYVQASKRQQKYLAAAPDLGYAAICESERMMSIYRLNYGTSGVLRRRHGPQVSVGQQHLIFLEDTSEILGICCENEAIVLLLEGALVTLQLTIEE